MEKEWFPSLEEYNPGITKEQWIEFVLDKNIFNENALITFACIQKAKVATCADMAEEFGRNTNFYNSNVWRTGERIYEKLNCPLWQRENGTDRFWSVCCFGRDLKNGRFEFKIRSELQEAFNETGVLEGIEIMGEKENISCIMANIAWNENDWKSPSDNKTNFRWTQVEGNIPNESWNFDFDNPRNSEKEILGFTQFTNPPKNAEKDKFLIIFRSDNKIIGFYGNAEIKKVPLMIKEDEYVNLLGDKKFSVLLKDKIDDSNHNFLFGKKKIGQVGFNYLNPIDAQTILDEAIKLNPNQMEVLNKLKDWLKQGDTQMPQEDTLVKKYANLLKNTKNLILTGAPGTGKTYLAKTIAARLILDREINNFDKDLSEEEKKQVESQTGFVQFHPSYDYTDFVEGLRPTDKDGNGNVGFERKDGVFKKFCEKAILPSSVTEDIQKELNENPTIWKVSLERTGDNPTRTDCLKNGYIRLGWSNYGDIADFSNFSGYTEVGGSVVLVAFQSKMKVGDIVLSCYSATEIDAIGIVTGDYEYRPEGGDYPRYRTVKWIVKGIKENIVEKNHGKTLTLASVYKLSVSIKDVFDIVEKYSTNQTLSSDSQEKTSNSPYVFIIDEINRGEVAKIFGELFYCVDPGYRGKEGKINTQYQNLIKENNIFYSGFFIPENVYIIGTMNDIDRSVESMDFAFRRRFSWIEVKAEDTQYMLDAELDAVLAKEAKRRMNNLNAAISKLPDLNAAYHIGASYFLKLKNYESDSENGFQSLWNYHLKGILEEYLRGNPDKDKYLKQLENAYNGESDKTSNQQ